MLTLKSGHAALSFLVGCIQVLCRQSDFACAKRYRAGVYAVDTGIPVNVRRLKPLSGTPTIDPVTYVPKSGSFVNPNNS